MPTMSAEELSGLGSADGLDDKLGRLLDGFTNRGPPGATHLPPDPRTEQVGAGVRAVGKGAHDAVTFPFDTYQKFMSGHYSGLPNDYGAPEGQEAAGAALAGDALWTSMTPMTGALPFAQRGAAGAFGGRLGQPQLGVIQGGRSAAPSAPGRPFADPAYDAQLGAVRDIMADAPAQGIRAYHGSPHDFDRFDMSKIGTGEGAQSYGHGLYFAENEATAKSYREALSNRGPAMWTPPNEYKYNSGHMYEVNINAKPEQFLDWDKPLSAQSEFVSNAARRVIPWGERISGEMRGPRLYDEIATGQSLLNKREIATERWREAGVPGIKYLDQGSRSAGTGTNNYVLFDDKIITILKKYGVSSVAALPPAVQMMLSQSNQAQAADIAPNERVSRTFDQVYKAIDEGTMDPQGRNMPPRPDPKVSRK